MGRCTQQGGTKLFHNNFPLVPCFLFFIFSLFLPRFYLLISLFPSILVFLYTHTHTHTPNSNPKSYKEAVNNRPSILMAKYWIDILISLMYFYKNTFCILYIMLNPIPNANFKHLQSMKYARVFSIKRCNLYNMVAVSFKYNQ